MNSNRSEWKIFFQELVSLHAKIVGGGTGYNLARDRERIVFGRHDLEDIRPGDRIKTGNEVVVSIRSLPQYIQAEVDLAGRKGDHDRWPTAVYLVSFSISSSVIPDVENPPSCIRFCIVTMRVKSENMTVMNAAQSSAEALPRGDIIFAYS